MNYKLILLLVALLYAPMLQAQDVPLTTKEPSFEQAEEMPKFPGNINEYISRKLKYPTYEVENGIEGTVMVQFIVSDDGAIRNIRILKSLSPGCDAEVVRVIGSMPKWIPATENGKNVSVNYKMPINFVLADVEEETEKNYQNPSSHPVIFPGGKKALLSFNLKNYKEIPNYQYPEEPQSVLVEMEIDEYGQSSNYTIKEGLNAEADAEALRMAKSLPFFLPKKENGDYVPSTFTISFLILSDENVIQLNSR